MLDRRFTCVRLSHPYITWSIHAFNHNVYHRDHCVAAACGSLQPLPAERLRGTFPHLSYSMKLAFLLGTTEGPTLISRVVAHANSLSPLSPCSWRTFVGKLARLPSPDQCRRQPGTTPPWSGGVSFTV